MADSKTKVTKNIETRELTVERTVRASRQLVWDGWTKAEHIVRWWGPKGWTTTVHKMDVRPGGVWHYSLHPDDGAGQEAWGKVVYEVVDEPSRLVYIDSFSDEEGNITEGTEIYTTVAFSDLDDGTRIVIRTVFNTAESLESAEAMGMVEGFSETLDRLEMYLGLEIDNNK